MLVPSQIGICNRALDRIRAPAIADINENSLQAQKCRLHYPEVIANMLEGPHDWSFANQRVQMAQAGTNARPFEWLFAYLLPANCASPICVLPDLTTLGLAIPVAVPGEPFSEAWAVLNNYALPYVIEAGILYCNAQNAWLDFTINDIAGIPISNLCARAIEIELAMLLAVPVKGDSTREKELATMSELAWQKAIADDRNRQPQCWGNYVSEAISARHDCDIVWPRYD